MLTIRLRIALSAVAACVVWSAGMAADGKTAALRSPWDGHPIKVTNALYACPAAKHLSRDLTTDGFYSDAKSSVIDPVKWKAYTESSGPYKQLGQEIVDAADAWLATGSRQAGQCALQHMTTAAKDGVFTGKMSSRQAYYVQGWVIGAISIAYLKIRDSGIAPPDAKMLITPWLVEVVHQTMDYYDTVRKNTGQDAGNNHLYWAGLEAAAAGVAANDHLLFDWGVGTYRNGIDQIKTDGSLPLEMKRGQRALHYHLYALAPLVYLAEFGEANGLHLYAERDQAIAKLVHLSIQGIKNNEFFERATGIPQDTPSGPPAAEQISWAQIWESRFPDPDVAALLAKASSMSYMYLGGLPPGANHILVGQR
jgi:poly(beta-D-mannuronate) lyase